MDLMQPTMLEDIIDIGVATGDISYVLSAGGKMLCFALLGVIGGCGCTLFSSMASMDFGTRLRSDMYGHIQTFSFAEIDRFKTSSLITRLTNDVTQLQNMVLMLLRMAVRAPLTCLGGIVMALVVCPTLSPVLLVAVPVLFVFILFIVKKTFPLFMKMQQKIDRVNTVMRENLLGVRVVKAFVGEKQEEARFAVANDDLMNFSIRAQKLTMLLWPVVTLVMNLSIVAVLWFGGSASIEGKIESGQLIAFMNYILQVLSSVMMTVMLIINFSRAKASAQRINEVMDTRSSILDPTTWEEPRDFSVSFEDVCFRYDPEDPGYVLQHLTFTAREGETVGIIGGTGSGKSSMIGLIPRFYDVTEGSVRIGGVDVRNIPLDRLREHIGVVMQDSTLFSGSVEDNLRWGASDAAEQQMNAAMRDAQAYEFVSALPQGLQSEVEQRGKNFSGGQKQRLSIARTLIKQPDILILDDSTSAVDMSTEAKIQTALKQHRKPGGIVFLIAQRISAIADADQILVLDGGRLIAKGTHKQLLKGCDIYRSIAVSQLGEEVLEYV